MGDEDKQFEASQQKLERVKKEGQVVKSKDLSIALGLLVMFTFLYQFAPFLWDQVSRLFVLVYEQIPNKSIDKIGFAYLMLISFFPAVLIIAPILMVAFIVGFLGDFMQIGPLVTTTPLIPKLDKLDPVKGFKNIFSIKSLFELGKNILKVAVLGFVGFVVFKAHIPAILTLCAMENTFSILYEFGKLIVDFVIKAGMLFIVIAGADYMFNKWKFLKDQKMSFKELKDEYKNTEGDPYVKAALRQRRMQMLQQSMLEAIPGADFVVTNPVHVAVAVKYNADDMRAPRVLAKGSELFAKKIIDIAMQHNIPVIENPPVARALYRLVDINREIPPELYKAVAEILMFVYNLREKYKTNSTVKK
jgi:flagellar biosynthesis protein FlhB